MSKRNIKRLSSKSARELLIKYESELKDLRIMVKRGNSRVRILEAAEVEHTARITRIKTANRRLQRHVNAMTARIEGMESLTEDDVACIKGLCKARSVARENGFVREAANLAKAKIADKFDISPWLVGLIADGLAWPEVESK